MSSISIELPNDWVVLDLESRKSEAEWDKILERQAKLMPGLAPYKLATLKLIGQVDEVIRKTGTHFGAIYLTRLVERPVLSSLILSTANLPGAEFESGIDHSARIEIIKGAVSTRREDDIGTPLSTVIELETRTSIRVERIQRVCLFDEAPYTNVFCIQYFIIAKELTEIAVATFSTFGATRSENRTELLDKFDKIANSIHLNIPTSGV